MQRLMTLILFSISLNAGAFTGFGVCNFGKETVDNIICYGPTVLKDTSVQGDVKIAGSFKASAVSLNNLIVAGSADIENTTVAGNAEVEGSLNARGVTFAKQLNLRSDNISLEKTTVASSVTINAGVSKPTLKLSCGSKISGPVIFEGNTGSIQITDDSVIEGKIVNGQMEFVKKACT